MWDVERSPDAFRGHLCFCHSDLQPANILVDEIQEKVHFIDYEYACLGFIEYDIAYHWCEWCSDYCSATPHIFLPGNFPSVQQQHQFIRHYLKAMAQICHHPPPLGRRFVDCLHLAAKEKDTVSGEKLDIDSLPHSWKRFLNMEDEISESDIEEIRKRVLGYVPLAHFLISLWSIVEGGNTEFVLDFDFEGYAEQRLSLYRSWTKNG